MAVQGFMTGVFRVCTEIRCSVTPATNANIHAVVIVRFRLHPGSYDPQSPTPVHLLCTLSTSYKKSTPAPPISFLPGLSSITTPTPTN